jgi:glycosyltransferase involved in cell wall biosynthesis
MRILYVSDAQSVHTRRWAACFRDRGAQVHVASFRAAQIDGVAVHHLPTAGLGKPGYLLAVPALRRLAARLQPDVVHAQYLTSYGFLAAAARLHPLVVTAWGSDVLVSPRTSRLARWLTSYALRHADAVTTVAEHMNAAVIALGAEPGKVSAAPFGVDTALFRPPAEPRAAPPPLRIISTRNFAPVYSVHTVVDAVQRLHAQGMALQLALVGTGPLRAALQAQVQAAGLQGLTTFHGHVDHPQLVRLLGAAQVFVSSALSDGNNVSLNEAMACGCLPVATDIAANAQWVVHGENGLLFPAGDAAALAACIERAGADGRWRDAAALANRGIVEQRADWNVSVHRMQAVYDRLMALSSAHASQHTPSA